MMEYQFPKSNIGPEQQLFEDLKYKYPQISPEMIQSCMIQCSYKYDNCIEFLNAIKIQPKSVRKTSSDNSVVTSYQNSCNADPGAIGTLIKSTANLDLSHAPNHYYNNPSSSVSPNPMFNSNNQACMNYQFSPNQINNSYTSSGNSFFNSPTNDGPVVSGQTSPHSPMLRPSMSENNIVSRVNPANLNYKTQFSHEPCSSAAYGTDQSVFHLSTTPRYRTSLNYNPQIQPWNPVGPMSRHHHTYLPSRPEFQPLHVITEPTVNEANDLTAISTNVRPNNQHEYLVNPSLTNQSQASCMYNRQNPQNVAVHSRGFPPDVNRRSEDQSFQKALIQHQKDRLEDFRRRYLAKKQQLDEMRKEIDDLEEKVTLKLVAEQISSKSQLEELKGFRQENRKLNIQCQCMAWQVDLYANDNSQDFFSQLNTGPLMRHAGNEKRSGQSSRKNKPTKMDSTESNDNDKWACEKCTYLNSNLLDSCEICEMVRIPQSRASGMQ